MGSVSPWAWRPAALGTRAAPDHVAGAPRSIAALGEGDGPSRKAPQVPRQQDPRGGAVRRLHGYEAWEGVSLLRPVAPPALRPPPRGLVLPALKGKLFPAHAPYLTHAGHSLGIPPHFSPSFGT